jgi:hypothetical protein
MKWMFALIVVLIAVAAMAVPSLAMGTRGWISAPVPVVTVQPDGSYLRGPCLFTGTKSLSPCRPDLGVLPSAAFLTPPGIVPMVPQTADAMPKALAMEPMLPPPRLN